MDEKYLYFADLAAAVTIEPDRIVSHALHGDDSSKIVLFGFDAGQVVAKHKAPGPAIMRILRGEAEWTLGGETKTVTTGSWVWMPAHLPHSIAARTPVVMLLTMLKTPTASG